MVEKQSINGKDVWLRVDALPAQRANPNIIPTEYFRASYFLQEPNTDAEGEPIRGEDGDDQLFESPVAAISFARKKLEGMLH